MATYNVKRSKQCWCKVCGQSFITNKTALYCSNKCRQEAYRMRQEARQEARRLQLPLFPD